MGGDGRRPALRPVPHRAGRAAVWLALVPLAAATTACSQRVTVCARVGRHKVETAAFQAYLGAVTGQRWQGADERVACRLLDQFLDQEVVAAAARLRRPMRIPIDPGERAATVRALLPEVCGPEPALEQAAVERELVARLQQVRPARAHVRQMVLDSLEEAEAVRRRLVAGEDFAELSREASRAANAADGGEIGYLSQGALPPELDRVVFTLRAGEISAPVQGPSGYHVFQVLEILPAGAPQRAEEEARVTRELGERQARQRTRACVDRLAGEVGVTLYPEHLWFQYRGRYAEDNDDGVATEEPSSVASG